jgi:hypothetical protein
MTGRPFRQENGFGVDRAMFQLPNGEKILTDSGQTVSNTERDEAMLLSKGREKSD